jgi:hypothetical protein
VQPATNYYSQSLSNKLFNALTTFDQYTDQQKERYDPLADPPTVLDPSNGASTISRQRSRRPFAQKLKLGLDKIFDQTEAKLKNAAQNFINSNILAAAALLNRTLNEIYNSLPIIGGIPPPKNVYAKPNEWEQAYINFLGPGLKTFFEDPLKFRKEGKPGETLEDMQLNGLNSRLTRKNP